MKRYMNMALLYAVLAMVGGVFYREFTKFNGFTAKTTLSVVHTHYFLLGMVVFLLLLVFGGWCVFWLVSLLCEKAGGRHYLRLCHWALFLVLFGLVLGGMLG